MLPILQLPAVSFSHGTLSKGPFPHIKPILYIIIIKMMNTVCEEIDITQYKECFIICKKSCQWKDFKFISIFSILQNLLGSYKMSDPLISMKNLHEMFCLSLRGLLGEVETVAVVLVNTLYWYDNVLQEQQIPSLGRWESLPWMGFIWNEGWKMTGLSWTERQGNWVEISSSHGREFWTTTCVRRWMTWVWLWNEL